MIYVMSDIHGRKDLFDKMLDKIGLTSDDTLYILGDMVDRGGDLSVLFEVMKLHQKGICVPIRGNHEKQLSYLLGAYVPKDVLKGQILQTKYDKLSRKDYHNYYFDSFSEYSLAVIEKLKELHHVVSLNNTIIKFQRMFGSISSYNCGRTLEHINKMDAEEIRLIKRYLKRYIALMPVKAECVVNGKKYMLVHGGYDETKESGNYLDMRQEFFLNKVKSSEPVTVVFGHTTTRDIRIIKDHELSIPYKIWYDDVHHDKIGIDCGACYPHGQLACLCLDTMEEFYIKNDLDATVPISYLNDRIGIYRSYQDKFNSTYAAGSDQKLNIL